MREAISSDKYLIIDILAKSFDDNMSVNYVAKQDVKRKERIRSLMAYSFDVCSTFGKVWLSEDNQACALVLFPDKKRTTLQGIALDIKLVFNVIGVGRVTNVLAREGMIKKNHPKSNIAYLWFVGVNPDYQSKGIGSKLMHEIVLESERMKRPVYLETSVERNILWYKKFGFEIYNSINLTYKLYLLRKQYNP